MATTVWHGHISFGLVSIPVRLFRAARKERIKLRELYKVAREPEPEPEPDEEPTEQVEQVVAPVTRAAFSPQRDEVVRPTDVTKGFEIEPSRLITLDREELRAIEPKTATEMEILEFVHLAEVDPVYFESSYYVRPEEAGEQAYALLYEAMRQSKLVAVARFAMHRREHVIVVRPGRSGILAHTMFYETEVRADQEFKTDTSLVNPKNLQLATMLTKSLEAKFEPSKYRDTYREKLEALIESKRSGVPAATAPSPQKRVTEITEALRKSLAAVKKPATSVPAARQQKSRKRR